MNSLLPPLLPLCPLCPLCPLLCPLLSASSFFPLFERLPSNSIENFVLNTNQLCQWTDRSSLDFPIEWGSIISMLFCSTVDHQSADTGYQYLQWESNVSKQIFLCFSWICLPKKCSLSECFHGVTMATVWIKLQKLSLRCSRSWSWGKSSSFFEWFHLHQWMRF